jgi:hypothetical protein
VLQFRDQCQAKDLHDLELNILPIQSCKFSKVRRIFFKHRQLTEKGWIELEVQEVLGFEQVEGVLLQMPKINQH